MENIVRITRYASAASLSSYVHVTMSMLYTAETLGVRGYVDWSGVTRPQVYDDARALAEYGANMWEWYFKQPQVQPHEAVHARDTWIFELGGTGKTPNWKIFPWCSWSQEDMDHKRSIIPRLLLPNDRVVAYAAKLFEKYGLKPEDTIAVSYRGTDAPWDGRTYKPISSFFEIVDRLIGRFPTSKVWLQTDDSKVVEQFKAQYPAAVHIEDFVTISQDRTYVDVSSPKRGYERGLDAAAMMVMMARCKVLVKNHGNLADMAASISTGEIYQAYV